MTQTQRWTIRLIQTVLKQKNQTSLADLNTLPMNSHHQNTMMGIINKEELE